MNKIEIMEFYPPYTKQKFFEKFIDFLMIAAKERSLEDKPPTRELMSKWYTNLNPNNQYFRWIAFDEATKNVIGTAYYDFPHHNSPEYESNKQSVWAKTILLQAYRRQGIGTRLIYILLAKLKISDKTLLQVGSDEVDGISFMDDLGVGRRAIEESENRLYVNKIDWGVVDEWVQNGPKNALDVKLIKFQEVDEQDIENFTKFYTKALNTVPKEDSEWEGVITPETRRDDEERHKKNETDWISIASREENGDFSGVTEILYNSGEPQVVWQELTAVLPKYRGKGLGKWLKAEMLLYIKEKYSQVEYIGTGNANSNAAMLGINNKLGFKFKKIYIEFKFNLPELYSHYKL